MEFNQPIFEFGREMQQLINNPEENQFELEIVLNDYLSLLRDHYLSDFVKRIDLYQNNLDIINIEKTVVLKECKAAMISALPIAAPSSWTIDVIHKH
jgi:hypothetical protein